LTEAAGIIVNAQFNVEKTLRERKAFNEKSAVNAEEANVNFQPILNAMEKNSIISRTKDGKIFLTTKGQERVQGFTISSNVPPHTIIRFSRNK
jgi:hypothetical protein